MSRDYTSVKEAHDAVGLLSLHFVVSHHDDSYAVVAVEVVEQVHHLGAHGRVKIAGRFVGEDDCRLAYDCTGDSYALTLAAAELRGQMFFAVSHLQAFEHFVDASVAFGGADALAVGEREFDIGGHVKRRNQVKTLEHEANIGVAKMREGGVAKRAAVGAEEVDGAFGRPYVLKI